MKPALLFRMSVFTYQALQQYRSGLPHLPAKHRLVAVLESPDCRKAGYLAESRSHIIIAFRGTEDWNDLKRNMAAAQVDFPLSKQGGKTHKGYTELYVSLRPGILLALKQCARNKPLYIAGHSLGGALASLCALDPAVAKGRPAVKLVTFGAPRIGDGTFADALHSQTGQSIRIYLEGDLVPNMPPRSLLGFTYVHAKSGFPVKDTQRTPISRHGISAYAMALSRSAPAEARRLSRLYPEFCPPGLSIGQTDH
ncbi:MAG: hypothetical protein K0R57_842 [Paenibacillaceae bacterium]|jgi:triacylglycerol lipase|nr:hypothetical protein [Paenibacillaceae bacterium]